MPQDLLANLIEVTDHDLKEPVRRDYARRCSKYYQWLVKNVGGAGCPVGERPTPLPAKCLPGGRNRLPYPNFIDYTKIKEQHFAVFLSSIRKTGRRKPGVEDTVEAQKERTSHSDVRKYKDALFYHMRCTNSALIT